LHEMRQIGHRAAARRDLRVSVGQHPADEAHIGGKGGLASYYHGQGAEPVTAPPPLMTICEHCPIGL
jgi:hypothetical protein